nr:Chain G, RNA annealing protein YRA1 [Saccharomyces cerevisiae S288C]5SUP_H Chain H, RNA annealing protein YRA1 [Saccharomyces cerevisiae S288C]5SUP_I Chain I, RNA annealing protein YRA1 [Saccharomyces cerevisiae S288C]
GAMGSNKPKREKPAKKSLEDLDKEMADYFEKK